MSETLRGFVLLLSIVLWLPALRPFLDGDLGADQAALRYAGALLLSWGGVALLATIVKTYTPEREPEPEQAKGAEPPSAPSAPPASTGPAATAPAATGPAATGPEIPSLDDTTDLMPDGTPRRRAEDMAQ